MLQRLRACATSAVALLLCLWLLVGSVCSTAAEPSPAELLNYENTGMTESETLTHTELLSLLGVDFDEVEAAYLDAFSGVSFRYNHMVPDSNISTFYQKETGTLQVTATPHVYVATNGARVEWIPTTATIDGDTRRLTATADGYGCSFEGLLHSGDFSMDVEYSWEVTLPEEVGEALFNTAYLDGSQTLQELIAYELVLAEFTAKKEAYDAYLAYLKAKDDYAAYCEALDQYEKDLPIYREYQDKYEAYLAEKAKWDAWEAFYEYEDFRVNRLDDFNKYVQYCQKLEEVTSRLAVLESLFVKDSNNWQLYGSLMGSTVTTVLQNQSALIAAGCNAADINRAGSSTEVLRVLMKEYAELRSAKYPSEHARVEALYGFYTRNYQSLKVEFGNLYGALKALYGNTAVVTKLDLEGKLAHYQQFVGQLYITASVLDDGFKQDVNWTIGKLKLYDVVEECHRVADDRTADPTGITVPAEVPPVEEIAPVEKPAFDQPQVEPKAPTPVIPEPVQPTPVTDPDTGVIPPVAADPGAAPTAPTPDARLRAVAEAIRGGTLHERDAASISRTLTLDYTVERTVSINNKKLVTFYAADGKTVLDQKTLEYGESFLYDGPSTKRDLDAEYYYEFLGWNLPDGTRAELVAYTDLSLIAGYRKTPRFYTVTWILGDRTRSESLRYGVMPVCPFETAPAPDAGYTYEFSGWDREVTPVTGDVTYRGEMTAIPRLYTVTWILGDRTETSEIAYGTYPSYPGTPSRSPDNARYTFLRWDTMPVHVAGDATYTAIWERTPLALDSRGEIPTVTHTEDLVTVECTPGLVDVREAVRYARETQKTLILRWEQFSVSYDEAGLNALNTAGFRRIRLETVESAPGVLQATLSYCNNIGQALSISVPAVLTADPSIQITLAGESGENAVGEDGVAIDGGFSFRIRDRYTITVGRVENCNISKLPVSAGVGTPVDLRLPCSFGYEVSAATVRLADGTVVPTDGLTFLMPSGDVMVELTVTRIVYHVSFVVDGVEILAGDYFLGEQITLPPIPTKASDGVYDYTFSGWSQEVSIAYGEDRTPVYEAQFTKTPISAGDPYVSGHNNNWMLTIALPIVAGVGILLLGFFLVRKFLKKKSALATEVEPEPESSEVENEVGVEETPDEEAPVEEALEDSSETP